MEKREAVNTNSLQSLLGDRGILSVEMTLNNINEGDVIVLSPDEMPEEDDYKTFGMLSVNGLNKMRNGDVFLAAETIKVINVSRKNGEYFMQIGNSGIKKFSEIHQGDLKVLKISVNFL